MDIINQKLEDISEKNIKNLINDPNRKTLPFLTKYEKTKVLGLRIQQLVSGSQTVLSEEEEKGLTSYIEVAEKELKLHKIPLIITRRMPNNKNEYWHVKDLIDFN